MSFRQPTGEIAMAITFHNPKSVSLAGKYSLGAEVPQGARLFYVSGQVGVDSKGKLHAGVAYAADPLVPAPQGAPLLLELAADGVQIYACEAKGQGFEWVFKSPEANLFDQKGLQVGTHFAGPTWKIGEDAVVGEVASR